MILIYMSDLKAIKILLDKEQCLREKVQKKGFQK